MVVQIELGEGGHIDFVFGLGRHGRDQTVVQAVAILAARGKSEDQAYEQLRGMAMAWRVSFEEAAGRIVNSGKPLQKSESDHG